LVVVVVGVVVVATASALVFVVGMGCEVGEGGIDVGLLRVVLALVVVS
jgi:hypothetical protein